MTEYAPNAVSLATADPPIVRDVGGKAASLIRLRQAAFDVPRGVVLTTGFFEPWLAEIRASKEWQAVLGAARACGKGTPRAEQRAMLERCCQQVSTLAAGLPLPAEQTATLQRIVAELDAGSFAVRSSSPDEDLSAASFAGLYETVLGVDAGSLKVAVRPCFRSCLDAGV